LAFATDDAEKAAARELSNQAKVDYDAGRFDDAARKFRQAFEVAKVPTLAVWTARSLASRGRLVAASELYRQASQLSPNDLWVGNAQQEAQSDAAKELNLLLPRIPRIRIHIEGAAVKDVEVTISGAKLLGALLDVDRMTDPGDWTVVGKRGSEVVQHAITLKEAERQEVTLNFKPEANAVVPVSTQPKPLDATAADSTQSQNSGGKNQRLLGWVTTGVGAAGLLTGAVAGIVVMSKHSSLDCPGNKCSPPVSPGSVDSYNSMRTVSTTGFIVGGIATIAGVTLILTSPKNGPEPAVGLWVGPTSAGASGVF
jgi:hypothetical protein